MTETVSHPQHYNTGKIEVIDFIEDQKFNFNLGNCVKYVSRADHKGKTEEDLQKAHWYLTRELKTRGIKTTEGIEYDDKLEQFSDFIENIHENDINSYEEKIGKLEQMERKLRDELSGLYAEISMLKAQKGSFEAKYKESNEQIISLKVHATSTEKLYQNSVKQIEQLTKVVSQQEKQLLDIYYDNIHYRMK